MYLLFITAYKNGVIRNSAYLLQEISSMYINLESNDEDLSGHIYSELRSRLKLKDDSFINACTSQMFLR